MPMIKHILTFLFLIPISYIVSAQKSDVKDYIISGNQNYMEGNFAKAEAQYKSALGEDSNSIKGNYNLGNSLYKQKRMDEARVHYDRVIQNLNATNSDKHKAYHNIGKSYLDEKNPEKAVANLKEALKLNPYDDETRYNYALARKQLEEQQEKKDEKNQEKKENQDGSNEDQKDSKDNAEKQDEGDKGENNENQKPENENGQQPDGENGNEDGDGKAPENQQITKGSDGKEKSSSQPMNTERQEGLLDALRQQEQETLKKIISQKAQKVRVNTEKDW